MERQLASTAMLLCSLMVFAQFSGTVRDSQGVKYTANDDESTCYVSGHENIYNSEISIPEEYQGRTVTSIGKDAFISCSGLTSVTIPNSVTSIGSQAFFQCSGLTSITIGNSVTSIGRSAFWGCSGLTSITIPNSVTSIGDRTFYDCSGLTSIVVENGNSKYDSRENCNAIIESASNTLVIGCQNTIIPNSVTSIYRDAFRYCSGLTSITIPNSVTDIGHAAFKSCKGLASITIGNNVVSIADWVFDGCSSLTSVNIPNSVTSIGAHVFSYCSGLTSISIPNSVTSIGDRAFYNCSSLPSITIPNSVSSIGDYAFYGCNSLTSVTIPSSVNSIGNGAFFNCTGFTSIVVENGNSVYDSRDNCNALIETSTNTLITGCMNTAIPNNVTSIGEHAFSGCTGLASITIPNSVTSIGSAAFQYCNSLTSVNIPNSVTSIGSSAFEGCTGLTSILVDNGNPVYDSRDNCNALVETSTNTLITGCMNTIIPNSVVNISYFAFWGCTGLTSITIPSSVTNIGHAAFYDCTGLTSIISKIQNPFEIEESVFSIFGSPALVYEKATLMVPVGSKSKYEVTNYWNKFTKIVEMDLTPVDGGETVDFGDNIDDNTNLDGNIVGDIYFNISSDDGGYNSAEGCIVVNKPTDDTSIGEGQDIFGEDFRDNFTGIVFKVPAGTGTIKVEAQTTGGMVLKVKIGNSEPVSMELDGKLKVSFPYNVTEPTFVYIYGGSGTSNAPGILGAPSATSGELKLYGIEVDADATGISLTPDPSPKGEGKWYSLDGQLLQGKPTQKGVYIMNGRKVVMK